MINFKNQINLCNIYEEVVDYFEEDKPKFIKLFQQHIEMKVLITQNLYNTYYSSTSRLRDYSLFSILTTLFKNNTIFVNYNNSTNKIQLTFFNK